MPNFPSKIITISGYYGSGKDYAATIIEDVLTKNGKSFLRIPFAKKLKELSKEYFPAFVEDIDNKTDLGRKLLQGTGQFAKKISGELVWVNFVAEEIAKNYETEFFLIPDTRFEFEIKNIISISEKKQRELKTPVVFFMRHSLLINGKQPDTNKDHESEQLPHLKLPNGYFTRFDNYEKNDTLRTQLHGWLNETFYLETE